VRIIGMSSEDNEVEPEDESRTYRAQSYPKRMLVITAGSLMHLVIAASLIVGIYSFSGRYQETGQVRIMEAPAAETAAAAAGLQSGDRIVAIDGESMRWK
jgi:regulator of sigma E protease